MSDYPFKRSKPKAQAKYKCEQCPKEYVHLKPLQNHYKIVHEVEFMSIKDQVDRIRNEPIIMIEEMTEPKELPKAQSHSELPQSQHTRSYSIGQNYVCTDCRFGTYNHLAIRKYIEKYHKSDHMTIRVQCDKCGRTFNSLTACKQHQWNEHIKDDQLEFPGNCCELGCMKKYADLGSLRVHHNRHLRESIESGEQIKQSAKPNCQFEECETEELLIETPNKHGKRSIATATETSGTQIVINDMRQGKSKSESNIVDKTGAKQIIININQFNSPQQSVVEKHNSKEDFNIAEQNIVAFGQQSKHPNNVHTRNRKIIRRDPLSMDFNPHNDFDYREQFGQQRITTETIFWRRHC